MNTSDKQDLHDFGYRPVDQERTKWAKPVGYSIYCFDLATKTWQQKFRHAGDGTTLTWDALTWDAAGLAVWPRLLDFLAYAETAHSKLIVGDGKGRHIWGFQTEFQSLME